jgi:ABC-type transport system substrate-binding protein
VVNKEPELLEGDRPYLDGIEWIIIRGVSTRYLAFIAGKVDMYSPHNITI